MPAARRLPALPTGRWPRTALLVAAGALHGCGPTAAPTADRTSAAPPSAAPSATGTASAPGFFTDITAELGLPATRAPMPDGSYALPEIMGPGVALFDYDNDGDLDLLERRCPPPGQPSAPAPDRLWQRQPDGRYVDVSEASGLHDPSYAQGVAIGDVDDDGDLDVYCCNLGHDAFYRNRGDGTFAEETAAAGFADAQGWNCASAFFDADRDGDLDLLIAEYVTYSPTTVCRVANSAPEYCGPKSFPLTTPRFYKNDGSGHFVDATQAAGFGAAQGSSLGLVCADFTGDGWPDVYVANDAQPNFFWQNRGDGTFVEQGIERSCALNRIGKPEGSMGVAVGDVDGDQFLDLMVTNIQGENNTLYTSDATASFSDVTPHAGMARYDLERTGFGCAFLDVDLDGDLDVAVVNGRVRRGPLVPGVDLAPFWNPFGEPNFLALNRGNGVFDTAGERGGDFTRRAEITRGLAFGDLDDDGDLDLVTTQVLGPLRVYRNDAPHAGHWLRVRARTGKRDAYGADLRVVCGARTFRGLCLATSSYVSSHDPRVHFGLGAATTFDSLDVTWPSGRSERFAGGPADRTIEIVEGTGQAR